MDMRITGRLDWGRLARIHLLDTRQHRDAQACPPGLRSSGAHGGARATARPWPTPPAACWAPRRSAGWPKAGAWTGRGTWWRSRR
jgi:hypothetical protein